MQRRLQAMAKEAFVERHVGPGKEPDANLAFAVVQAAGDEIARMGDEIDHVPAMTGISARSGPGSKAFPWTTI